MKTVGFCWIFELKLGENQGNGKSVLKVDFVWRIWEINLKLKGNQVNGKSVLKIEFCVMGLWSEFLVSI